MKKFIAVMMVLVMMGVAAHAELRYATAGTEKHVVGTDHKGKEVTETIYYLTVTSDVGDCVKIEVSKEDYDKIARKEADAKKTAFGRVKGVVTFWNPDD